MLRSRVFLLLVLMLLVGSACSSGGTADLSDALLTANDIRASGYDGPVTTAAAGDFRSNPDPRGACGGVGDAALDFNHPDTEVILEGTGFSLIHVIEESTSAAQRVAAMRADAVEGCSPFVSQTNTGTQLNEMLELIDIGMVGQDRVAWRGLIRPSNSELQIGVIASVVLVDGYISAIAILGSDDIPDNAVAILSTLAAKKLEETIRGR